jgi:predicted DCC family thiol-disulfide oxidoreductase YuxK
MPARPIVLFDGDCGFCTAAALAGEKRWPGAADVAAWQQTDIDALGLTPSQCSRELQLIGTDGTHAGGAAAIGRWLEAVGGLWRVLGRLAYTPPTSWMAAGFYKLVAANRSRLPGGTPSCRFASRSHSSPSSTDAA